MAVYVLGRKRGPLDPCSKKRARGLLESGWARFHWMRPFTIRLIDRKVKDSVVHPLTVPTDPGSKTTGIALVWEAEAIGQDESAVQSRVLVDVQGIPRQAGRLPSKRPSQTTQRASLILGNETGALLAE